MPGVPSGKACDACRKQKKKCDELQPTCSRCQRLSIPCMGSGAKRYKWSIETKCQQGSRVSESTSRERTISPPSGTTRPLMQQIGRSPSNAQNKLAMTLVDRVHLQHDSDLRYNLTWAYGNFIQEVPRRLGKNAALDAAATSLAMCHVRYSTGRRDAEPAEIAAYGNALRVLRECLDDRVVARETNTLCAVTLLLLAQQMIGQNGCTTGHGEGAALILKARGVRQKSKDKFEIMLLSMLRGPLLFEGLFNPRISLTDDEWAFLVTDHMARSSGSDFERLGASWASFPRLTAAARQAWASRSKTGTAEFKELLKHSWELYDSAVHITNKLRVNYTASAEESTNASDRASAPRQRFMFAYHQRILSMAVFTASYINCLIRAMLPPEERLLLFADAFEFSKEIVSLAHQGMPFRPLGSGFMLLCLMVAWFSSANEKMRRELEDLWEQYSSDFPATRNMSLQYSLEQYAFLGGF